MVAVVCNAFYAMKNGHHKTGEQCFVYLKNESINKQWLCCMDYGLIIKTELDIIIVIICGAAWGWRCGNNIRYHYHHHAHTSSTCRLYSELSMENEHVQHVNTIGSRRYLCAMCVCMRAHAKSVNRHNKTLNELKKAFYV